MSQKVAVITGSSSGFGLLTAVELAAAGYRVVATMRNLDRRSFLDDALRKRNASTNVDIRQLDIAHTATVQPVIDKILADYGRVDVLVNNAGFAMAGFLEDVSLDELRRQFETNFFGHVGVTKAALPAMRRQRSGHIIMVTSIGGRCASPVIGSYAASKFALEGWSEALRIEMQPLGVQVVLVEPGAYATDIWERNAQVTPVQMDPNSPNHARGLRFSEYALKQVHKRDAREVAQLILRIAENPRPKLRYLAGPDAHIQLLLKTVLPWRRYERLIAKTVKVDQVD
ncbi:MAG TPA: SDR family oxidoreductase [Candidatus Koribacter sp.]|jgi:NAD(P)-dependent dehydrogenase (short-subunit alcohol dehydrogenase family)